MQATRILVAAWIAAVASAEAVAQEAQPPTSSALFWVSTSKNTTRSVPLLGSASWGDPAIEPRVLFEFF